MADVEVLFETNEYWPVFELDDDEKHIKGHRDYYEAAAPTELRWIIKVPQDLLERFKNVMQEFQEMQNELRQYDPNKS